jgi:proteic killer suppression protein
VKVALGVVAVDIRFKKKALERLYSQEKDASRYPPEIVTKFFDVMAVIAAAPDERDFYKTKSLHYEKLQGPRAGEHSFRLNNQWRLTAQYEEAESGKIIVLLDIEDYH